jgi:hypothetical protein
VIAQARAAFVPIKLQSDQYADLAVSYGFSVLPATAILRPDGEIISRVQGYGDTTFFLGFLRDAVNRYGVAPKPARGRLALGGVCPVSLVDARRLVAGQPLQTAEYEGARYRFASAAALDAFRKAPERYVPVNGGRCPVASVDRGEFRDGSARCGVVFDGHLYLCATEDARARFFRSPDRYAHVDVTLRDACPHCWGIDGGIVPRRASTSLTRAARRPQASDAANVFIVRQASDAMSR